MPVEQQLDLAERLLADDEQALEEIVRQFGPAVQAVIARKYRGLLRPADAEDVLAIGLFRLWTHRRTYDETKGSLRVWFFRIVDNAARDVLRHGWQKARQLEVETEPHTLAGLADHRTNGRASTTSTQQTNDDAAQQALREIIAELPEMQRRIVTADALARDETVAAGQLADELGIPPGTVRVYRKRALDKIRSELARRGFGPY
jgi:RNA polymerase sigma factor (sigma-70 family)